jgi:hypothetical protein
MNVLGMFNRGRDRHIGFIYGELDTDTAARLALPCGCHERPQPVPMHLECVKSIECIERIKCIKCI